MMFWDFSLRQRAEDRFQEGQNCAAEQRLLNQARAGTESLHRSPQETARRMRAPRGSLVHRLRRKVASIAGISFLLVVLVGTASEAMSLPTIIRNIADGVLGEGSVTAARVTDNDRTALIRWESATYKPAMSVPEARELMYLEAALVTGAIRGRLSDVVRIRFTIVRGDRMLATGENSRDRHLWVVFAKELGGGSYNSADPRAPKPSNTDGGQPLQDL